MTPDKANTTVDAPVCDRLAVAVLLVCAAVALAVFRDYGLGWDDYAHKEYGDLLVSLYGSGFSDTRALSFVNLYMYGGGFDLLAALVAKILPFTVFETRRLVGAAVGIVGLIAVWRTARRLEGPFAGISALVVLVACPFYVGHLFMNAKDGPFAVAMAILLCGLVRMFEQYPRPCWTTRALAGLGLGLSIGSRVMGGFGVIAALGALTFLFIVEARADGMRHALARLGKFLLALLPAAVLAYAVMALVWPWAVIDPLNPLRAVEYFSRFFEEPWDELFGGKLIPVTEMPRSYVPTLLALKLPVVFFILALFGVMAAVAGAFRDVTWTYPVVGGRRAALACVVLMAILPIAATVAERPAMYNGIRHFVFIVPPMAVLAGLAASRLREFVRTNRLVTMALALFAALSLAAPVADMVRLHPYEYTYFNRLSGGIAHARENYMLDYWALSFKQAAQGLKAKLAELDLAKPPDRRWKLATCGPHRSPQVELGPDFETTWDSKGADFALMLGEFYCARLDAPVWVDVTRKGVSYARVYDIRERSIETLLTRPGLKGKD